MAELRVGSRELKARLGRYVRIVREGGSVTITEWGRPVARLVPVLEGEARPAIEERVQALVREGRLLHGGGARLQARCPQTGLQGNEMLSDLVVEERDRQPMAILGVDAASDSLS